MVLDNLPCPGTVTPAEFVGAVDFDRLVVTEVLLLWQVVVAIGEVGAAVAIEAVETAVKRTAAVAAIVVQVGAVAAVVETINFVDMSVQFKDLYEAVCAKFE